MNTDNLRAKWIEVEASVWDAQQAELKALREDTAKAWAAVRSSNQVSLDERKLQARINKLESELATATAEIAKRDAEINKRDWCVAEKMAELTTLRAQPAIPSVPVAEKDASEYQRGFKDGYQRRDDEVMGSLA